MFTFTFTNLLISTIAAVIIVTVMGCTKAAVSVALGDKSPRREGRLSANPLKHIEVVGLFFIILLGFGWGKPMNTSGLYYKNRKRDTLIVHIAPSVAILVMGMVLFFIANHTPLIYFIASTTGIAGSFMNLWIFFHRISFLSISLAFFNMVPIYPMDGAKVLGVFLPPNQKVKMASMEKAMLIILIVIMLVWPGNPISTSVSLLANILLNIVANLSLDIMM